MNWTYPFRYRARQKGTPPLPGRYPPGCPPADIAIREKDPGPRVSPPDRLDMELEDLPETFHRVLLRGSRPEDVFQEPFPHPSDRGGEDLLLPPEMPVDRGGGAP